MDRSLRGQPGAAAVLEIAGGRLVAAHRIDVLAGSLALPGSVIKPFVMHTLEQHGAADLKMPCDGRLQIARRRLDCTHVRLNEAVDSRRALAYSCNNWFAASARRISARDLEQALRNFGFGSPTGLARGEQTGTVELARDDDSRRLEALGEWGVRVTPLEVLTAYRRLALMAEQNPEIARDLAGAADFGTAQLAKPVGASIAAKTGTTAEGAWLAGWIPARKPRYAVVVYLPGGSGGSDAAPVARQIFTALMAEDPHAVKVDGQAIPFEEYVAGVVAGEAGTMRSPESLKAMAVVARTWAAAMRGRHGREGFDFCSTTHCQNYRPAVTTQAVVEAVRATAGEMLWFGGRPALTYYSRDCGGVTEAGGNVWPEVNAPYLRQHSDPWCRDRGNNAWTAEIQKDSLWRGLREQGVKITPHAGTVRIVSRTPSGRVAKVAVGNTVITGAEFRFMVGRSMGWNLIRSDMFNLRDMPDSFTFTGTGGGHGVGMCQKGAAHMGDAGRDYRQILAFYYPGTTPSRSAGGLDWIAMAGERVKFETVRPNRDRPLVHIADVLARQAENRIALRFRSAPVVRVYPDVASYRDGTGEPGWVAGSTLAGVIRLQPNASAAVLRHELLHELVEQNAAAGLPVWFREGVVLYLENPSPSAAAGSREIDIARARSKEQMVQAYEQARSRVQQLVEERGERAVLGWITSGLPDALRGRESPTQ